MSAEGHLMSIALSCATGGFVIIRHNDARDLTGELLKEVCNDVELEPPELLPLSTEKLSNKTSNKADGARVDVSARGFWQRGRKTFLDVRVFNPLAKPNFQPRRGRLEAPTLKSIYRSNENAKKREYNERILRIDHGTFTPMVFSTFGGIGYEGNRFLKKLNEKIAEKRFESLGNTMSYIRTKYSFSLLRTTLLCIRGTTRCRIFEPNIALAYYEQHYCVSGEQHDVVYSNQI